MPEVSFALTPPFLPETVAAADESFPIRITKRAKAALFAHLVNAQPYAGPCLRVDYNADAEWATIHACDPADLPDDAFVKSKFGRTIVGVPRDHAGALAGYVLDRRSFPPGSPSLYLRKVELESARNAGFLKLSVPKLKAIHPELFHPATTGTKVARAVLSVTSVFAKTDGNPGWLGRLVGEDDPAGQAEAVEAIASRLGAYPAEPAVVVSTAPFVVAAYMLVFDHVMILRLPQAMLAGGPNGTDWAVGDQLISCNSFDWGDVGHTDVVHGQGSTHGWNCCWNVLADFVTDDTDTLARLKAAIPRDRWEKARRLGEDRLQAGHKRRDGRPWLSRCPADEQDKGCWKRKGGYVS